MVSTPSDFGFFFLFFSFFSLFFWKPCLTLTLILLAPNPYPNQSVERYRDRRVDTCGVVVPAAPHLRYPRLPILLLVPTDRDCAGLPSQGLFTGHPPHISPPIHPSSCFTAHRPCSHLIPSPHGISLSPDAGSIK